LDLLEVLEGFGELVVSGLSRSLSLEDVDMLVNVVESDKRIELVNSQSIVSNPAEDSSIRRRVSKNDQELGKSW